MQKVLTLEFFVLNLIHPLTHSLVGSNIESGYNNGHFNARYLKGGPDGRLVSKQLPTNT